MMLHIQETVLNGCFSLDVKECISACDPAPTMLVDIDLHGSLESSPFNIQN